MHKCLFCGHELKAEDILFGVHRDDDGSREKAPSAESRPAQAKKPTSSFFQVTDAVVPFNLDDPNMTMTPPSPAPQRVMGGINSVSSGAAAPEAAQVPEANIPLGEWVADKPYEDFLAKFLYMNVSEVHKPQEIFAVRWSSTLCIHKLGKADGTDLQGGVPLKVRLSEEDAKVAGREYLTNRFCPHCHCKIMNGFLEADERDVHHMAFVGGSRAGKTQYLTALYQNLCENASLSGEYAMGRVEVDELSRSVMNYLSKKLSGGESKERGGEGHLDATPIVQILPVVMCVTQMDASGMMGKKAFVAIHDCPGEIFSADNADELVARGGLNLADSLLFMADPAQLFQSLFTAAQWDSAMKQETCMLPLVDMVAQFSNYFSGNQYKCVALIITKMDQVFDKSVCELSLDRQRMGEAGYRKALQSRDSRDHRGGVDMNAIMQVSNDLCGVLTDDGSGEKNLRMPDAVSTVRSNLPGCSPDKLYVFGVSTYSRPSDDSPFQVCGVASVERHRLLEPLLYLWAELGVVLYKGQEVKRPQPAVGLEPPPVDEPEDEGKKKRGFWIFGRR